MLASNKLVRDIMETIEISNFTPLPSGENLEQQGYISPVEGGLEYEILSKNTILEYVDYLNLTCVVEILGEFFDVNAVSLAKDGRLCAAALGSSDSAAFEKIIENEPLSITDAAIGFSKEVSVETAKQLKNMQIRNLIAPKFSKEALKYLTEMTDINIIQIKSPLQELLGFTAKDIKVTPFGYLIQEQNHSKLTKSTFKVAGKTKPTQQMAEDAIFAWKIAKYTKSNSAVIAKDLSTKAIIQGCQNPVDGVEKAMDYACENSKDAVLALDGVIENEAILNAAIQGRIGLIIESGNGVNSNKIAKLADKYNIVMIKTGIKNYRY